MRPLNKVELDALFDLIYFSEGSFLFATEELFSNGHFYFLGGIMSKNGFKLLKSHLSFWGSDRFATMREF